MTYWPLYAEKRCVNCGLYRSQHIFWLGPTGNDDDVLCPVGPETFQPEIKMTETQRNPEQDVLDDIDRALRAGEHWDHGERGAPKCPVCDGDWHGLTGTGNNGKLGCPGEFGTDDEKEDWTRDYEARQAARLEQQRKARSGGGGDQNPKDGTYYGGAGSGVAASSGGGGGGAWYTLADVAALLSPVPWQPMVGMTNAEVLDAYARVDGFVDLDDAWVDLGYIDNDTHEPASRADMDIEAFRFRLD
jgi:hypothetical protein